MSAVVRAVNLLKLFTPHRPELSLAELAADSRLSKATILRLVASLSEGGLVFRSPATGNYCLGSEFLRLAEVARCSSDFLTHARPFMREVRDRLQETTLVGIRSGDFRVNLEQAEGLQSVRRVVAIGEPVPLYVSATSKVLLASMSDDEIAAYLARTELNSFSTSTLVDPARLWKDIATIRQAGFAEAVNEGGSDGAAVSSPVLDKAGSVVGAFTVSAPVSRFTLQLRTRMVAEVKAAARSISSSMGHTG